MENRDACGDRKTPCIFSFWHYSILFNFYFERKTKATVMVSASEDGEYISEIARKLQFETVRGSRNKGGLQALRKLIKSMRKGGSAGIVIDGSQGPALVAQAGAVVLASKTGSPILPMLWSCSNYFRFNSWDKMILPKPFSRIDFFYGEPLYIAKKISSDEIEASRLDLEDRLNAIYKNAWALYGKDAH